MSDLSPRQRALGLAFASALFPPGRILPGAGDASFARVERLLGGYGSAGLAGYGRLLDALELRTVATRGRRFSRMTAERRAEVLEGLLTGSFADRTLLLALAFPLKNVHLDDPALFARFGCVYDRSAPAEPARWRDQVVPAERLAEHFGEDDIECDVVVVGTGAGGAVVAKELAEAGHAVVMVEEGDYHDRSHFTGRAADCIPKLYRDGGLTYSVGNTVIPIPIGRAVGGTTTVNAGTCFRTPDRVLARWRDELGLTELTPGHMEGYFAKVERELRVAPAKLELVGGVGRVVARGAERLGWSHHPLRRNAPDCDGQGVCTFGCPTDAKRSTNVSYVPMALERSALLVTGFRAERVTVAGGRAVGLEGRALANGETHRIRARIVVLACGTLITPLVLARQGLGASSKHLGRNLTIHPAVAAAAEMDEPVHADRGIPQGYCVDQFHERGILMEGSTLPLENGATALDLVGRELVEAMEGYDRMAFFGAMVSEKQGAGRVRLLPGNRPLIEYWVTPDVLERLHFAMVKLGELFLAAGARRVFPTMTGVKQIRDRDELDAFAKRKLRPRDLAITAYHPLGTCRIGKDPASGPISPDQELYDVPGLYVCDGSAVPSSPTVNPQVTIMALATRAAERMANRLS